METMEKRSTSFKILASKPDEGGAIQAIIAEDRDAELSAAKKVLHVAGHVLLIDRGESIVVGSVSGGVDDGAVQWRRLACLGVRPVADMCRFLSSSRILVVVTAAGEAIRVDWTNDTVLGPIDELREQPGSPAKSDESFSPRLRASFRLCSGGDDHLVLVDRTGQAWSWGKGPQTGRVTGHKKNDEKVSSQDKVVLTRVDSFQGYKITALCSGIDYSVALAESLPTLSETKAAPLETSQAKSAILARTIQGAVDSDFASSRASCPLGLPIAEDVRERDISDELVVLRKDSKRNALAASSSQEGNPDSVERLAQSGLYLNPTDALKYLTDQLSWVGLNSSGEDQKEDSTAPKVQEQAPAPGEDATVASGETPAATGGGTALFRATTNAIGDGMKLVGQTVSRLSSSFSTDKEDSIDIPDEGRAADLDDAFYTTAAAAEFPMKERLRHKPSFTPNSKSAPASVRTSLHRRSQSASILDKISSDGDSIGSLARENSHSPSLMRKRSTEVWFWGRGGRGQAGQGDMLDRLQPTAVDSLTNQMVLKVACGRAHTVALTLTGRVFGWGENADGQCSQRCTLKVCSSPTAVVLPTGETCRDVAAVENSTLILTDCGKIYCLGVGLGKMIRLKLPSSDQPSNVAQALFAIDAACFAIAEGPHDLPLCNYKSLEKLFLHKLSSIFSQVIDPMYGHFGKTSKERLSDPSELDQVRESLHRRLLSLMEFTKSSVAAAWNLNLIQESAQLAIVKDFAPFEEAFHLYGRSVCDGLVCDCFTLDNHDFVKYAGIICDLLQTSCHLDPSRMGQDVLAPLLINPLLQLEQCLKCLVTMSGAGRRQVKSMEALQACDMLDKCAASIKAAQRTVEREQKITEGTKRFWDLTGNRFACLKNHKRRVLLDSRDSPISVCNAGSFSKNWIVLMNDVLVHAGYSTVASHPLQTIWIESFKTKAGDGSGSPHAGGDDPTTETKIVLVMPEETLVLSAPSAEAKNEWYQALQKSIVEVLRESSRNRKKISGAGKAHSSPPIMRKTDFTFKKIPELKGAVYRGNWVHGKMHGYGKLFWPGGRTYVGQMRQNQKHGLGRLVAEDETVYEGHWVADRFEGYGVILHKNGDRYDGFLKDGHPHGQGVFKQGKFCGGGASVYMGEWLNGVRSGYGISDDIVSGEKYMGMWCNDMKSGSGCVVTLDGVYYEGTFSHNKMTGRGLMLFEDETCYEGTFADAGVFSGNGTLTYESGDRLEGSFYGNYTDGMKFNGTIFKNVNKGTTGTLVSQDTPLNRDKIGRFSVPAPKKWASTFAYYHELLCLPEPSAYSASPTKSGIVWDKLAILINQAKNNSAALAAASDATSSANTSSTFGDIMDGLEMIPDYTCTELTSPYLEDVSAYLSKAFNSPLHPLENLLTSITSCFNSTYGGVRVHPRLLKHSVEELASLVERIYFIVRCLFPALPTKKQWIHRKEGEDNASASAGDNSTSLLVTSALVLHPHILPRIHSSVFMLYALYYKKDDDEYWMRILKWNKHPDLALLSFLGVDQKFWRLLEDVGDPSSSGVPSRQSISTIRDAHFVTAIETLQQIKTKFTPREKLDVIVDTFRMVNAAGIEAMGSGFCWSMDDLFPVFQYVVVRARILQLGAEIHLIEDLMEPEMLNGEYGIMFTTLQATYYQILKESLSL